MRLNSKELLQMASNVTDWAMEGMFTIVERGKGLEHYLQGQYVSAKLKGNLLLYRPVESKNSSQGLIILQDCQVNIVNDSARCFIKIGFENCDDQSYEIECFSLDELQNWYYAISQGCLGKIDGLTHVQRYEATNNSNGGVSSLNGLQESFGKSDNHMDFSCCRSLDLKIAREYTVSVLVHEDVGAAQPLINVWLYEKREEDWVPFFCTDTAKVVNNVAKFVSVFSVSQASLENAERIMKATVFLSPSKESLGSVLFTAENLHDSKISGSLMHKESGKKNGSVVFTSVSHFTDTGRYSALQWLKGITKNAITKCYHVPTLDDKRLHVQETMMESRWTFSVCLQYIMMVINEEEEMIRMLKDLGELNDAWNQARLKYIKGHTALYSMMEGVINHLAEVEGMCFRPSTLKDDQISAALPTNLHMQLLQVTNLKSDSFKVYPFITCGAPAAHYMKFKNGGVLRATLSVNLTCDVALLKRVQSVIATSVALRDFQENMKELINTILSPEESQATPEVICTRLSTLGEDLSRLVSISEDPDVIAVEKELCSVSLNPQSPRLEDFSDGSIKSSLLQSLASINQLQRQYHKNPKGGNFTDIILQGAVSALDEFCLYIYHIATFGYLKSRDLIGTAYDPHLRLRRDIVFSQSLSILVNSFITMLITRMQDPVFFLQLSRIGFLFHHESLLTCFGDEKGMIEDMVVGALDLRKVFFKIVLGGGRAFEPIVLGRRSKIVVTVSVPLHVFQALPHSLQKGCLITVSPVLFSMGVNENVAIAEFFGDTSLQDSVNESSLKILDDYAREFRAFTTGLAQNDCVHNKIVSLLKSLSGELKSRKARNVDIFSILQELTLILRAGHVISCKSAKDRTAMSLTLHMANCLQTYHMVSPEMTSLVLTALRAFGTRIENACKNIGTRLYSFNILQVKKLPVNFHPPEGTYHSGILS